MTPVDEAQVALLPVCAGCGHPEDSHVAPGVCAERLQGDGAGFCCCEGFSRVTTLPAPAHVLSLVDKLPKPEFKWSPVEMLEALLADIKAGKATPKNLMIFFMEEIDGGKSLKPITYSANCSYAETIAFCELEKARALDEWRKG